MSDQEKLVKPIRSLSINKDPRHNSYKHRVVTATPATGLVRIEWVSARYHNQIQPTNWSMMDFQPFIQPYIPLRYQIADAENLSVKFCLEQGAEWLLFIEHDNVIPPGTFVRLNEYMVQKKVPVVSALYFTKSVPPEPMVYRDFGHGYFGDWKMGDKVWVKGCPLGCTLIHSSLLKVLWDESPEYEVSGQRVRRVFETPNNAWFDPEKNQYMTNTGTSDLFFCKRLVDDKIFTKAGWPEYQEMEYPILCDTNIFVKHIDDTGQQWPLAIPEQFLKTDDALHVTMNINSKAGEEVSDRKIKLHFNINGLPAGKDAKEYFKLKQEEILAQIKDQMDADYEKISDNDGIIFVDGSK